MRTLFSLDGKNVFDLTALNRVCERFPGAPSQFGATVSFYLF